MGFPHLQEEMFADDSGPVSPLSVSGLYITNDGTDGRPFLDQMQSLGVEAVRWFASPLTPGDFRAGVNLTNAEQRAEDVAIWLADRKMWGHASGFCDTASSLWGNTDDEKWAAFRAHADWLGRLLKTFRHLVGEGFNEIEHGTQYKFSWEQIESLINRIRAAGYNGPLTTGAWLKSDELVNGVYPPAEVEASDVIDTHFQRTDEPAWDMSNHGFAELRVIQEEYQTKARMSGEPKRTDDGVWPPRVWAWLLAVEAQGFNTWTTLHGSQLRDAAIVSGEQLEDLKTYLRAGKLLPRGRYHFENTGWGGSPIKAAAFVEGPSSSPGNKNVWRAHSFQHLATGQWFLSLSGPNVLEPFLQFQNGFELDKRIDVLDQYCDLWTLKQ